MNIKNLETAYCLSGMTKDDLRSLLRMIASACLEERRTFDKVKRQINEILKS